MNHCLVNKVRSKYKELSNNQKVLTCELGRYHPARMDVEKLKSKLKRTLERYVCMVNMSEDEGTSDLQKEQCLQFASEAEKELRGMVE